jgi:hypothetical protein
MKAAAERVQVDQGVHVANEKRKGKLDMARARSFRGLAEDYMRTAASRLSEATRKETRRYLDKDILPRLGIREREFAEIPYSPAPPPRVRRYRFGRGCARRISHHAFKLSPFVALKTNSQTAFRVSFLTKNYTAQTGSTRPFRNAE